MIEALVAIGIILVGSVVAVTIDRRRAMKEKHVH